MVYREREILEMYLHIDGGGFRHDAILGVLILDFGF